MSRYIPHEARYFWKQDRWNGGQSEDSREGMPGAYRFAVGLDVRFDSGIIKLAKRPVLHSTTPNISFTNLIKWIELNPANNDTYIYSGQTIYKEAAGVYSVARALTNDTPNAQGLTDFFGHLYYRTSTWLGRFDYNATWVDNYQTGLTATSTFAPMCRFLNMLLIANGRYIDTIDDIDTYTSQRITLPAGYTVRDIFILGKNACILAMRGNAITDSDQGMMFLWNGTSTTYDDFHPIDGNPHAGISNDNEAIIIAGSPATIQKSLGGQPKIMHRIPNLHDGEYVEVYPGAKDLWNHMVHFGISDGSSSTVTRAVWNYGARNGAFDDILNAEFPISYGNSPTLSNYLGTNIQITAVRKVGTTLRFAWRSGSTYGIDQIDTTQYVSQGIIRTLAFDRESPFTKVVSKAVAELAGNLAANESVELRISPDPYGDPQFLNNNQADPTSYKMMLQNTPGAKRVELPIVVGTEVNSPDLHEQVILNGNGSSTPQLKRIWAEVVEPNDLL